MPMKIKVVGVDSRKTSFNPMLAKCLLLILGACKGFFLIFLITLNASKERVKRVKSKKIIQYHILDKG